MRAVSLGQIEGLHEIVVGAGIEPVDAIRQAIERREDDHRRRIAAAAQVTQEAHAVPIGKHEIEQHEIVGGAAQMQARNVEAGDPVRRVPFGHDLVAHRRAENLVVLDQEDSHEVVSHLRA